MNILGINSGRAVPPQWDRLNRRPLMDGSAALLRDGRIACATIEERHTRIRYSGGFARAMPIALAAGRIKVEQVDAVGFSTCCDTRWLGEKDRLDALIEELRPDYDPDRLNRHFAGRIHLVDHHESHATLAFVGSGFRRSLVCVMDGYGNRLDEEGQFHPSADWWKGSFDRQTIYVAEWHNGAIRLELVHRSGNHPTEVGLGELYRGVTHFLGWPSYQFAGKTMALSSYGDHRKIEGVHLASWDPVGGFQVHLPNQHDDPVGQIATALQKCGYTIPTDLHRPATPRSPCLANVAALAQRQLEQALIEGITAFADRYHVSCIAIVGGVALNCVAIGKLTVARPDLRVYVPPAPGDTGQGLGNAFWLAYSETSPIHESCPAPSIKSAALGPLYGRRSVQSSIGAFAHTHPGMKVCEYRSWSSLGSAVAAMVSMGKVVALRVGRAEYGPRALGQCSILADPRDSEVKSKVNLVKQREAFRPFAASILASHASTYFDGTHESPFMSFAGFATERAAAVTPGVVHVDGTTRLQTVSPIHQPLGLILSEFQRQTGVPLILNTSFNLAGMPMVETPSDALDAFSRCSLDALVIDKFLVTKR